MGIEEDKTISYSSILLDYLFQEQRVKNKINFKYNFGFQIVILIVKLNEERNEYLT
ncbi:MAG: hypothetical protein ACTSQO_02560 [Candidatus Helarchaeota archaeon]